MKNLELKIIKPSKMTEEQKTDFINLHQQYLSLDEKTLIDYLAPRDYVLFYYDKSSSELVATVGVQLIYLKKSALIYLGNVVVKPEYKHSGCISHATTKYVTRLFIMHPFKRKFCCGLASSSGALEYSLKHRPGWPNPDEKTPDEILQLMQLTLQKAGILNYRIENGNLIAYNLCDKIRGTFHTKKTNPSVADKFFQKINPGAEKGEQVFFLNPFTIKNALDLAIHGLHSHLIRSPKMYHKIVKNKSSNPLYSIILIGLTLIKIRF